jgi:2,3,4,5-tetrahydropyridine-2-carboxylate N-succinyltransferase
MSSLAHGHGIATIAGSTVLDVWYPAPALGALTGTPDSSLTAMAGNDDARGVTRELVSLEIDLTQAPKDARDAYLRLHLLSHRLVKPHGQSLDGIFGLLANVVWTSVGPCAVDGFEVTRARLKAKYGHLTVFAVDKFPRSPCIGHNCDA